MEIIKSSTEISRAFAQGKRLSGSLITLLVNSNPLAHGPRGRAAFIAAKKYGGAVWRNQAKRRLRAIAREINVSCAGYDVIFIARPVTTQARYSKVLQQAEELLQEYLYERNL